MCPAAPRALREQSDFQEAGAARSEVEKPG